MALQPTKYSRQNELDNFIKIYAEFAAGTFKDSTQSSNQQLFTPLVCYKIFKKIFFIENFNLVWTQEAYLLEDHIRHIDATQLLSSDIIRNQAGSLRCQNKIMFG